MAIWTRVLRGKKKMNVIETIIEYAETLNDKTISQVLDDCIETAENTPFSEVNVNWFIELKVKIEAELEEYCWTSCAPLKYINNNRVIKTDTGLKITNQTKDLTILELYFPSEFNPNSILIKRCW